MFHSLARARTISDGLQRVVHRVGLGDVAVAPQPVAQDDGVDAVVVEERDEVGALGADVQRVVPAARHEDHDRAGVDAGIDDVELDRRVVDVDDALDAAGDRLLHVVHLGLPDTLLLQ